MSRVLLTNDDGIHAEGLTQLAKVAKSFFEEVWIVAPAQQASQIGHRVTTDTPLSYQQISERIHAVEGTPADCTRVALAHLLPSPPDWVWSGINHGGNLGRHDFAISGTVAAAREAAFLGHPAMAISHFLDRDKPICWEMATTFARTAFEKIKDRQVEAGSFWNINLPHRDADSGDPDYIFCEQERQPLEVSFRKNEDGTLQYDGCYHNRPSLSGHDVDVCFGGNVAICSATI